jgi:hypothetical protein
MEEAIQLILKMWTESRTTFHGRYFHVEDAILEPRPDDSGRAAAAGRTETERVTRDPDPRSGSAARPQWAEPLYKLRMPDRQLIRQLPEAALLGLGRMALNAVSGLFDAGEPSRSGRNESDSAQVHHERAGLAVAGCRLTIKRLHTERQRHVRGPRPAGRIGDERGRHRRYRRYRAGGCQCVAKVQRAGLCRVLVLWKGAPNEVVLAKRKRGQSCFLA